LSNGEARVKFELLENSAEKVIRSRKEALRKGKPIKKRQDHVKQVFQKLKEVSITQKEWGETGSKAERPTEIHVEVTTGTAETRKND